MPPEIWHVGIGYRNVKPAAMSSGPVTREPWRSRGGRWSSRSSFPRGWPVGFVRRPERPGRASRLLVSQALSEFLERHHGGTG